MRASGRWKICVAAAALLFGLPRPVALARDAREQARIEFVLGHIAHAQDIVFIRNGAEYGGEAAAKHLRRKLDHAGGRLHTAEEFIHYCATESSRTHEKYLVRLPNGETTEAAKYFSILLQEFDRERP